MTLHLLPVGVEIQIDGRLAVGHLVRVGEAPLLPPRGRACGAAAAVGTDQHGARARTVTALGRYDGAIVIPDRTVPGVGQSIGRRCK